MPQISATVGNSTNGMLKAYADFHGISFSSGVSTMASSAVVQWFESLSDEQKKSYNRKFKIFGGKK